MPGFGGANAGEFGLQNDRCSSQTLAPAATCTVQLVFTPASAAAKSAMLAIPSNDTATPNLGVPVSGTGVTQANTAPTVVSTSPADNAANVPVNAAVSAVFSETMTASSLTASTFTLSANGAPVSGTVAYSGTTATFTPSAPLAAGTLHTATITTGAKDLGGLGLAAARVWRFTTVSAAADNTDSDGDGVIDLYDDFPNNNRKTTFPPNHGKGKITVDITSVLGAYLTEAGSMSVNPQTGGLAGYHFNDGLVTFKVNGGSGAGTVALTYPETIPAGSKVYKVTQDGYREVSGAVISGNRGAVVPQS